MNEEECEELLREEYPIAEEQRRILLQTSWDHRKKEEVILPIRPQCEQRSIYKDNWEIYYGQAITDDLQIIHIISEPLQEKAAEYIYDKPSNNVIHSSDVLSCNVQEGWIEYIKNKKIQRLFLQDMIVWVFVEDENLYNFFENIRKEREDCPSVWRDMQNRCAIELKRNNNIPTAFIKVWMFMECEWRKEPLDLD